MDSFIVCEIVFDLCLHLIRDFRIYELHYLYLRQSWLISLQRHTEEVNANIHWQYPISLFEMAASTRKLSDSSEQRYDKRVQRRRTHSEMDCTTRFGMVPTTLRSRHFSITEEPEETTDTTTAYRKSRQSNSIPEFKIADDSMARAKANIAMLQISKNKLLKTRSTQNFGLFVPVRRGSKPQLFGKTVFRQGRFLRRVRSENNVIPAPPFVNRILVSHVRLPW